MSEQQSHSSGKLLLAELSSLREGIRRLEEKRLALEDNILAVIFRPPGEVAAQPAAIGLPELPESLPLRHLPVDCPHYFGWTLRAEGRPLDDSEKGYLRFVDSDGHLIAANIEPTFHYPMADLVAILHPDLGRDEAVRLILKLGSVMQETGIHQGTARLHTGQELPASLFLQVPVPAPTSPELKVVPPRFDGEGPVSGERPTDKLLEILTECLTSVESHLVALAEGTQASLRQDLQTLRAEVGHMVTEISAQRSLCRAVKTSCDQLTEAMRVLREMESSNAGQLDVLRTEAERFAGYEESFSLQVTQQQGELKALRSAIDEAVERLNRQADAIRNLHKVQEDLASFLLVL